MKNDMKLIMESWRHGKEKLLQEALLQEGILDWIKAGFKKLMQIPEKFDAMVEEAKIAYEEIMMDKLKNDPEFQAMGKEAAEAINTHARTKETESLNEIEGDIESEEKGQEEKVDIREITPGEMKELGLTDEQIEGMQELSGRKSAESVVEAAEKVVGKTAPPEVKDWLVRFIKRSSKMIAFGFVDNVIMITAGDYIDPMLMRAMGTSTMFAAGIGNLISDVAGEEAGGAIDNTLKTMGLDIQKVTDEDMKSAPDWMKIMDKRAGSFGVAIGCLLGMVPLVVMEEKGKEKRETII